MLTRSKSIPIPIKKLLPVTLRSELRSDESGNIKYLLNTKSHIDIDKKWNEWKKAVQENS